MKKFKNLALGILGAGLLFTSLFACNNDEVQKPQQEDSTITLSAKSSEELELTAIGNVKSGTAVPLYNKDLLAKNLVLKGLFAEIESIDLDYGYDSENNQHIAFFTIIGKNPNNFSLESFQAELIVDGNIVIMPDPNAPDLPITIFAKHSCAGAPCNSCSFTRTGFLNLKITGCKCNEQGEGKRCNHGINGGASTKEIVDTVVDTIL